MIKDFTDGAPVENCFALLEKKSVGMTKKNTPYLRVTLRDGGGSIDGVSWTYDQDADTTKEGDVVCFSGNIGSYNGTLQLTLTALAKTDRSADEFARWTKFDVEKMWMDLVEITATLSEPLTKSIIEQLLINHAFVADGFRKAPAARGVHNNWYGGLLEHVWSLCQLAKTVVPHYQKNYLHKISYDKVIFGLMLHDAGKILEYDYSTPSFANTPVGQFTPHMVLGSAWVYEQANKWWKDHSGDDLLTAEQFKIERAHLMHVLAAHHGRLDWGSPVVPASIEAILVHHLDNLDSKVMHAWDLVMGKPGSIAGFSETSRFERTSFWNYPEGV